MNSNEVFIKNTFIKLIFFIFSTFTIISCSSNKTILIQNEIPKEFKMYVDNQDALYQVVQSIGTDERIIKREAQLSAMSLIISRVESKIKSISELRQTNLETDFINITRLLSEFRVLNIELIESKLLYDSKSKKYTLWGVYKINSDNIISLLNKNESLNLTFDDIIQ